MTAINGLRTKALRRNQCVAALAIVGLYLQLAAGAFCSAGLPSGPEASAPPICHSSADGAPSAPKSGHVPQPQQSCPFCALHCHAAFLLPPTLHVTRPTAFAAQPQLQQTASAARLRFAIAAQPRGPPRLS